MFRRLCSSVCLAITALSVIMAAPVSALSSATNVTASPSAADQLALSHLKTRGDAEINRRLTTLDKLTSVINSTAKLSSGDKSSLTAEVDNAISGLNSLKTQLDGDSDLATARSDAQTIITDYRVYALVVPKVYLLKASDTELANDANLTTLAGKLQQRVTADKNNGQAVSALQASLDDMNAQINAAEAIANAVNAKVAPLQPTDYDSDHAILEGQRSQLQTAHQDNVAAYNDAKAIVAGLKNL